MNKGKKFSSTTMKLTDLHFIDGTVSTAATL